MAMGENSQIYIDLMRFKPEGMTPNAWAMKAGVSRTVWADMRRHGNPSRRTLQKLLDAAGSSLAEFEALRVGGRGAEDVAQSAVMERGGGRWGAAAIPPLPLVASEIGGMWGEPDGGIELTEVRAAEMVDRIPRPPSLANDPGAYALTVLGDSMWPRFRPGRRVAVSANAPIAIGDDVLVKLKPANPGDPSVSVLVKELVRRSGKGLVLRQFNPAVTFEVPNAEIAAVEKVVGELI